MDTVKNTSDSFWDKPWLKYGFIGAGVSIAVTVLYYVIDDTLLTDPIFSFLPLIALTVIAILAAVERKKIQSGFLTYTEGITTSLGAFAIGLLISTAFNLLLYFVIDPPLLTKVTNAQMVRMAEMVDEGKIPKESYEEAVKQITEKGSQLFMFNLFIGAIVLLVLGLIIFLISSAILRKEPKTLI